MVGHSMEKKKLCFVKFSSEIFQNYPYFWNKKFQFNYVWFFVFHFIMQNFGLFNLKFMSK